MNPREPFLEVQGPFAIHDMRCAIESGEHAVYCLNDGVFYPSRKAEKDGWRLVQAKTRFQHWLLNTFFAKDRP